MMEDTMKALVIATFTLGLFATAAYAQQAGTVTFNGNVFDAPSTQGAGYAQPQQGYGQPPAKAKTYHHVRRTMHHKSSAS
jgi:hypothetical protein